eukprot:gb/GECH01009729.1/.p1 GENE.gb/GECH01009729.1/~~gb/GECH01009729.1/.p1  ORF type:complete len:698 (+),score=165.38 gb/GECH01009729.1/:1-2094(+)
MKASELKTPQKNENKNQKQPDTLFMSPPKTPGNFPVVIPKTPFFLASPDPQHFSNLNINTPDSFISPYGNQKKPRKKTKSRIYKKEMPSTSINFNRESLSKKETVKEMMEQAVEMLHKGFLSQAVRIANECKKELERIDAKHSEEMLYILLLLAQSKSHLDHLKDAKFALQKAKKIIDVKCSLKKDLFQGNEKSPKNSIQTDQTILNSKLNQELSLENLPSINNVPREKSLPTNRDQPKEIDINEIPTNILPYLILYHRDKAYLHQLEGNNAYALSEYLTVLSIRLQTVGENHKDTATDYNNIGLAYSSLKQSEESLEYLRKALVIRESILGREHVDTATVCNNIGNVYLQRGDNENAITWYSRGLGIIQRHGEIVHPDVATCYCNIATAHVKLGMFTEAFEEYQKAINMRTTLFGENHPYVASCCFLIGRLQMERKQWNQAQNFTEKALNIFESHYGKQNFSTLGCYAIMGDIMLKLEKVAESIFYFETIRDSTEQMKDASEKEKVKANTDLANVLLSLGRWSDALISLKHISRVISIRQEHPEVGTVYNNVGNVLRQQGEFKRALKSYNKAKKIFENVYGYFNKSTGTVYTNIGNIYLDRGEYQSAFRMYIQANAIREKVLGKNHTETAHSIYNLALVNYKLQRFGQAYQFAMHARDMLNQKLGENNQDTILASRLLATIVRKKSKTRRMSSPPS